MMHTSRKLSRLGSRLALATVLLATTLTTVTTAASSTPASAMEGFACSTATTTDGTELSWTEVAPNTVYRIRHVFDGENNYLFNVDHQQGDPPPSAIVPYSFGVYQVIHYVGGKTTTECKAPDGNVQPEFVCTVDDEFVSWNRIIANQYSIRLRIGAAFDRWLANRNGTMFEAPSRFGTYTVIARRDGVVDKASCVGPGGAQPPAFECTIDGSRLTWTDQGVDRYNVRRLLGGGSSSYVGQSNGLSLTVPVANADYEVIHRIRGVRFSTPCDPPPPDECDPVGRLIARELNDRCGPADGQDINWTETLDAIDTGIWTSRVCADVLITAMRDELLVTVDPNGDATQAADEVQRRLAEIGIGSTIDPDDVSIIARIVTVSGVEPDELLQLLPRLQGEGFSTDLNYLEPLAPNNGFRPFDDPTPAGQPDPGDPSAGQGARVLVVDSTADQRQYDLNGNGLVDEDHGHGIFVASIIAQQAPAADIVLAGVDSSAPRLPSGRWAPMMFSDYDIVRAIEDAVVDADQFDFINLSLGGAGCTRSSLGIGAGERLALGRAMRNLSLRSEATIVAAAGNAGSDVYHFPAAWRDNDATMALAQEVQSVDQAAAQEIIDLHAYFLPDNRLIAVGSGQPGGNRDGFSNCGAWVNGIAVGADQVGEYPSETGYARWSGTSFAAPNLIGALIGGSAKIDYPLNGLSC